ncbi:hypothetical protein FD755_002103 [Muntiacus reevesi]|uniref:Uncharacterized protein n=2 Tax=Muntiacus TaxID=9885 RepID=A0A5J5N341_MUNRE|nr:hypothetical protein FD754_004857 [Muntiacus muntjak]KAB0387147.1 hypothetical protein FD755_002103 [Muntiacus reevesi]
MEKLGIKPSCASWILSRFCWQTSVKRLKSLYLFYICFCFSALWLSTVGGHDLENQIITVFSNFSDISFEVFVVLQWWLMIA